MSEPAVPQLSPSVLRRSILVHLRRSGPSSPDAIMRGTLGDLHYIRAQWNRGNMPNNDSWQQPLPPKVKPNDPLKMSLVDKREQYQKELNQATGATVDVSGGLAMH